MAEKRVTIEWPDFEYAATGSDTMSFTLEGARQHVKDMQNAIRKAEKKEISIAGREFDLSEVKRVSFYSVGTCRVELHNDDDFVIGTTTWLLRKMADLFDTRA